MPVPAQSMAPHSDGMNLVAELTFEHSRPDQPGADQNARQAPSFRTGKDSADSEAVLSVSPGSSAARCIGARR
jgi:hypothetical protein